jgi:hypothetical protein
MADEITLEQDVDEVLGGLQTVEADVTGAPAGRSDFEPEDGPEEDEEEHSDGDDGDAWELPRSIDRRGGTPAAPSGSWCLTPVVTSWRPATPGDRPGRPPGARP